MNKTRSVCVRTFGALLTVFATSLLYQPATAAPPGSKLRSYFLTTNRFDGSEALRGCASGFHMASIWEIFDTSNLSYNTTLGLTREDSGSGPPSGVDGWIRTGVDALDLGISAVGQSNCIAWTSSLSNRQGTLVMLEFQWVAEPSTVAPWNGSTSTCDTLQHVWCVQD